MDKLFSFKFLEVDIILKRSVIWNFFYLYPASNTAFINQFYEYAKLYNIIGIIYNLFPRDNVDGVKAWEILKYIKKQNGGKENEWFEWKKCRRKSNSRRG